jgi:hypothetical protein
MKTLEDVLEEIAPKPDPDFVADMERRMQQGFPSPERRRALPRIAVPDLRPRAWAGVAASAVLALSVTVALVGGGSDPEPDGEVVGAFQSADSGSSGGGAAAELAPAPPQARRDALAPGAPVRRVERSAQLTLASAPDDFDRLADSIFRTADRRGGFVLRSSFSQGDEGTSSGFFELRVPTNELERTLGELSRIATVRSRSESGNDVTAPFLSLRDRLRTGQAERKSLLRRLEVAPTDTAAGAIRRRLEIVGRRITSLGGQLRAARERTEFATVTVELVDEDAGPAAAPGETDEAVDDAVGTLEDVLNFLIRALAILLPLLVVAGLVWLGAARARRRARERALA